MLGLKQAKMVLAQLGLSEEQTNLFEDLITPHIEFHKFLMEKLNISSEEAEKKTETFSKKYITDKLADYTSKGGKLETMSETYYFQLAGESMKIVALDNGYDSELSNILEKNMIELSNMFLSIVKNNQEKI